MASCIVSYLDTEGLRYRLHHIRRKPGMLTATHNHWSVRVLQFNYVGKLSIEGHEHEMGNEQAFLCAVDAMTSCWLIEAELLHPAKPNCHTAALMA